MTSATVSPARAGTLKRVTAQHAYFAAWSAAELRAAEGHADLVRAPAGCELLALEDLSPYSLFLLEGSVTLTPAQGQPRVVCAGDVDADFPLAHLRPSRYAVVTEVPSELVRLESSLVKRVTDSRRKVRFEVEDSSVGGSWRSHDLVIDVARRLRDGSLEVPPVPGIAARIRRAVADDDYDMNSLAAIVSADPAIAARLIQIANSAVFGGQSPIESAKNALVRLGVGRTQNLVFTLATKGMFRTKNAFIKKAMARSWHHAVEIASLAAVLGKLTPHTDSDRALLIGLLHEIGAVPILKLAEAHPDLEQTPGVLTEILAGMVGEVSAAVLERWGFAADFATAAREQTCWFRDHEGPADYTDLVLIAHLHALIRQRDFHKLPRIDETPAFDKLALGLLSPQLSLLVLDESQTQITELKSLLT